ncbi:MAG: enoyl-CoA hydratase/isomerase family protein [Agarilytica sp.]
MTSDKVITRTIPTENGFHIGRITLNHPKGLNALSLDMVNAIQQCLSLWEDDKNIICVLIDAEGEKAFCAGGDIQAMYYAMQKNPGNECVEIETFFEHEYRMDYCLHTYPKPVIIWGNGIVMGGGLGIFMGGDFRIVTESARLAMPEITIGLYPDVGASYFLNQLSKPMGRFLGLTGAVLNALDCLSLGLATEYLAHDQKKPLVTALSQANWSQTRDDNAHIIRSILTDLHQDGPPECLENNIEEHMHYIETIFAPENIHDVIAHFLQENLSNKWLQKSQNSLKRGSPLSALLIDKQLTINHDATLETAFQSEMILSTNIVRHTELSEGIRALLIDKDHTPQWAFADHKAVPPTFIARFFESPWPNNPLENLGRA